MFKRVLFVLTLLIAHSAFAQEATLERALGSSSQELEQPVVTIASTTGVATTTASTTATSTLEESPAETASSSEEEVGTSSLVIIGDGASGTSSTSTVSTSTVETEEGTSTKTALAEEERGKLFDLVYAGFEEFVAKYFGWE